MPRTTSTKLLLGCVSYCNDILRIWDGMRSRLAVRGVDLDYATFNSYDRLVDALVRGHVDVAWNGPLAHVRAQRRLPTCASLGMRDVDRDFESVVVAHERFAPGEPSDLRTALLGKRVVAGAHDSPQAYVLPVQFAAEAGVALSSLHVTRYDCDVGKHGDTAAGEELVLRHVRARGAHVVVGFVSRMMLDRCSFRDELAVVARFPPFDHCQFDAHPNVPRRDRDAFAAALMDMDKDRDVADRVVMDMEGIRRSWAGAREHGYEAMRRATAGEDAAARFPLPLHEVGRHPFASLQVLDAVAT